MLNIVKDKAPVLLPWHVQTERGVTLASFRNRGMAESYRRSALVAIANDVQEEFGDRRRADEDETLP